MVLVSALAGFAAAQTPQLEPPPPAKPKSSSGSMRGSTTRTHRVAVEENAGLSPDLEKAEAALEKKDYATAEPLLKKVVEANDKDFRAWFDLGYLYHAIGHDPEAITAYGKSVAAKSDIFESNFQLGLLLSVADRKREAVPFLRAATKLKPDKAAAERSASAWMALGDALTASNPEEALIAFRHAAELRPADAEPHLATAEILEKQNSFTDAERELKKAVELAPQSSDAYAALANLYMRSRKLVEAEAVLRKFVELNPGSANGHLQLARVLEAMGHSGEAVPELEAALKLKPDDAEATRELADVYADAGKFDLAETQLKSLLQKQPQNAGLYSALGHLYLKARRYPEAQGAFLAALKVKPDLKGGTWDLAVAASENKNYPLVLQALDVRARSEAETPQTYFLRATSFDHLKDSKHAVENYKRFLEVSGGRYPDQEWQARHRLIALESRK